MSWMGGQHSSVGDEDPAPSSADFVWIDSEEQLVRWVGQARVARAASGMARACLDTEADSLHHYREKVCLLQVECGGLFALVDPLVVENVQPLFDLLDEGELWFHGADYDLSMLARTYDWRPKTMRDTQIAARLAGHRQFGLAALVKSVFDVELSKASQKADWSQRPLPEVMLRYAVDDVRYLLPIADQLLEILRAKGRMEWFVESCETLQRDIDRRLQVPKEEPWRVQGSGRLHPRGLALLRAAWMWRETAAAERDIPCFRVMSNKQLISFAEIFEKGKTPLPPGGWRPRWKRAFAQILEDLAQSAPADWPQRLRRERGRFSEEQRNLVDHMCAQRDGIAETLEIESSLLGSRATLEQVVASGQPSDHLMRWQQQVLAGPLSGLAGTL